MTDKEALAENIRKFLKSDDGLLLTGKDWETIVKALEQEPRAGKDNNVTTKTGHWIMHIDDLFPAESTMECSECGEHQPITIDDNYCPYCGARMESEGKE